MEQVISPKLLEFRSLIAAIRAETILMKKVILSQEEEIEETEILHKFDSVAANQVFSTLINLVNYQLYGWRELIDE